MAILRRLLIVCLTFANRIHGYRAGFLLPHFRYWGPLLATVCFLATLQAVPSRADPTDPSYIPTAAELNAMENDLLFTAAESLTNFGQTIDKKTKTAIAAKDCRALKILQEQTRFLREKSRVFNSALRERAKVVEIKPKAETILEALSNLPIEQINIDIGLAIAEHCTKPDPWIERYEQMGRLAKVDITHGQEFVDGMEANLTKSSTCEELKTLAEDTDFYLGRVTSTLEFVEEYCPCQPDSFPYAEHEMLKRLRDKLSSFLVKVHGEILKRCKVGEYESLPPKPILPKLRFGMDFKITDDPALKTTEKLNPTNQCPDFSPDLRFRILAPLAAAMVEKFKQRPIAFATKNYHPYYVDLVPKWVLFLETHYAICATPEDLKAFPPEIGTLILERPGTRLPSGIEGEASIGEDAVRKIIETYNAAEIKAIRDKFLVDPNYSKDGKTVEKFEPNPISGSGQLMTPDDKTGGGEPTLPKTQSGTPGLTSVGGKPPDTDPVTPTKKKTTSRKEQPKSKDVKVEDKNKQPAPTPSPVVDGPPRLPIDPVGGTSVKGGMVQRATGMYDDRRPAIMMWVDPQKNGQCKLYKYYQFMKTDFTAQWQGDATENDINKDAKKLITGKDPGIKTKTGSFVQPGEWSADDYEGRTDNKSKNAVTKDTNGKEISAGPYRTRPLKGFKKSTSGFIDAPQWENAAASEPFFTKIAPAKNAKPPDDKPQASAPPRESIGTLKIKQKFRTYLHCYEPVVECLGYFTWDYNETVHYFWDWKEKIKPTSPSDAMGMNDKGAGGRKLTPADREAIERARKKNWIPALVVEANIDGPVNISAWNSDCKK